jgi:hypothetical protein
MAEANSAEAKSLTPTVGRSARRKPRTVAVCRSGMNSETSALASR